MSQIFNVGERVKGKYFDDEYSGIIKARRFLTVPPYTPLYTVKLDAPITVYGQVRTEVLIEERTGCTIDAA